MLRKRKSVKNSVGSKVTLSTARSRRTASWQNDRLPRTTDSETSDRPILESLQLFKFTKETHHFLEQPTATKQATDRSRKYFNLHLHLAMPPKVDVKTLTGKMNNAVGIPNGLMEEFEALFAVKPGLETLEAVFSLVESKYRAVKKQQEAILDKLIEEGASSEGELVLTNRKLGDKVKADFLQIALKYTAYQSEMLFRKVLTTQKP